MADVIFGVSFIFVDLWFIFNKVNGLIIWGGATFVFCIDFQFQRLEYEIINIRNELRIREKHYEI